MKKLALLTMLVLSSLSLYSVPMATSTRWDSLFYLTDVTQKEALVTKSSFLKKNSPIPYPQPIIKIPSYMVVTGYMDDPNRKDTLDVVGIESKAFVKAQATSVVFTEPSNVTTIGTLAFSSMSNMTGKLVLPASLTNLSVSSILLPNITEIEFLGTTPPMCEIVDTYNPWTSASNGITPNTIKVTVPEGTWSTYKEAIGIGDYFTCFQGETPTGVTELENAPAKACKVMRNGQLLIQKAEVLYTAEGKVVER